MYRPQRESFIIQIGGESGIQNSKTRVLNFSGMKFFDRFRKMLMKFIFSTGSRAAPEVVHRRRSCDHRPDPPKTSCSSTYYSSNSHYNEAIADCIEFFNKSSQDGIFGSGKSDLVV
ncbi:unnamed protein product [Fraxinus pennsylvanica]|uniref:Uncharacterized protein n=1 Tax=Fraxinus pennsylvanica TaxID=56036 RepID=A0AAD2DJ93_9LAMI|nr:unnamed protein product [Fraxinus pennsylvanica]